MNNLDDADDEVDFERDGDWALQPEQHHYTIIHLDIDCFYAQVEMIRNPDLQDKPMGVKQKNLMVTSNYVARAAGVPKSAWIKEALAALPSLVLVDGSDLTHYRQFSADISDVLRTFTLKVERLGLDENFVDVSEIIDEYVDKFGEDIHEGHLYGDKNEENVNRDDLCGCGCFKRLTAAMYVAKEMRQRIFDSTGITCCAGVAHNKLLAKLVSGYQKPNSQTIIYPWMTQTVINSLDSPRNIPGIGSVTYKTLQFLGISTLEQLQKCSLNLLNTKFDPGTSLKIKNLAFGIDESIVRQSGRPASIGLEDACRKASSVDEVNIMFSLLIKRLLKLLVEDGRTPVTLKVTVRKYDINKRFGQRETKQCPISPTLFPGGVKNLSNACDQGLLNLVMGLFNRMVDLKNTFHLTLVGVAFTKFIEIAPGAKSITHFFNKRKREDLESQSSKDIETEIKYQKTDNDSSSKENITNTNFTNDISIDNISVASTSSDCLIKDNCASTISPSLPHDVDPEVFNALPEDIKKEILSSVQSEKQHNSILPKRNLEPTSPSPTKKIVSTPKNYSIENFFKPNTHSNTKIKDSTPKKYSIDNFFKPNTHSNTKIKDHSLGNNTMKSNFSQNSFSKISKSDRNASSSSSNAKSSLQFETSPKQNVKKTYFEKSTPQEIDPEVFEALPREIQLEILQEQKIYSLPTKITGNKKNDLF